MSKYINEKVNKQKTSKQNITRMNILFLPTTRDQNGGFLKRASKNGAEN